MVGLVSKFVMVVIKSLIFQVLKHVFGVKNVKSAPQLYMNLYTLILSKFPLQVCCKL